MGSVSLWMTPFVLFWGIVTFLLELLQKLAPVLAVALGVVSIVAAVLSFVGLVLAVRQLLPAKRGWVRVLGQVAVVVAVVAVVGFVGIGAIAFVAAAVIA
jgi:hypothetical protein